ncbi:GIY-YIG catalytic domain-containing protein [Ectopseudomonas chengduensis]|uniref:GIY-YIG catalytic domain-containing protein n=1 Tax=Ectopseudomonas chengduensis TaxID=489632 RepID=A0A1G6PYF4_9GAMM|nr:MULTISPECIES: GIY-YIG nuclease family protein [Pseudomonas]MBP3061987.1 GIY-YIG nuclease family protein [Pseudomonas chengduensis]NNB75281.1 GIY-YIG nuclease family protein [Pseudomonas chengduensis]OEO24479.1 hypothetical protein AX279_17575 [Pseudomonas sp. J237]SDC85129.1 GIY-YIG catalytic domain-containing protein [Pseudomonas chengduensis]
MPEFYYQIKGRRPPEYEGDSPWAWPPVFSGLVTAPDRKAAKAQIDEEYGRTFPQRVLAKDLEQHAYLLRIEEVDPSNDYILRRFRESSCRECGSTFRLIDKYNDFHADYRGADYCSYRCSVDGKAREVQEFRLTNEGKLPPVIYQIRQKSSGMAYVGQTTQPFTLRWWQHLTVPTGCKFHKAIHASHPTDWEYSILEVIVIPDDCKDRAAYITQRESHWIAALNSIEQGFNTARPAGFNPSTNDLFSAAPAADEMSAQVGEPV